jgi:hypothetical protein
MPILNWYKKTQKKCLLLYKILYITTNQVKSIGTNMYYFIKYNIFTY